MAWNFEGIVLPFGEQPERWWVEDDGVLRDGPAPSSIAADRLPGRFALPGLVDAHTHLTLDFNEGAATLADDVDRHLRAHLVAGVLAVRDTGVVPGGHVPRGRGRADRPDVVGGSQYVAASGTYFPALAPGVDETELVELAIAQVRAGADWVKVVADSPITDTSFFDPPPALDRDRLRSIVDAVHRAGGRVAAHVTGRFVRDTVLAGVDSIEHGSLVDRELLVQMAAHGTAWTPTTATVIGAVTHLESIGAEPMLRLARPHVERLQEMVPLAEQLGVTVLAGTDMLGHGNLAGEVASLVALGMSPVGALAAASHTARTYLGLSTWADGQPADLVTYDGDPREDPKALRRPAAIVHAGQRIR